MSIQCKTEIIDNHSLHDASFSVLRALIGGKLEILIYVLVNCIRSSNKYKPRQVKPRPLKTFQSAGRPPRSLVCPGSHLYSDHTTPRFYREWEEGVAVFSSLVKSCQCTDSQTLQDICSLFGGEVWRSLRQKLPNYSTLILSVMITEYH